MCNTCHIGEKALNNKKKIEHELNLKKRGKNSIGMQFSNFTQNSTEK